MSLLDQKKKYFALIASILKACDLMTNHTNHCKKTINLKAMQTSIISLIKGMNVSVFL